jgi:hypothetical protein
MKINYTAAFGLLLAASAQGAVTGFVTPSEMTITFTSLRIIRTDNSQLTLMDGTFPHTFRKSDTDFASVPLTGITAPAGRFVGVQVCYNTARSIKLNGDTYRGVTAGGYTNGVTQVYSIGSNAVAASSVQTSPPGGGATTMGNFVVGNGTNNCSSSYFARPVCVTSDPDDCTSGDTVVNAGSQVPNLNLLLDMMNSVAIETATNSTDNHIPVYPYPTIGNPGVAMHLTATTGSAIGNVSLLFGSDRKLLYSAAYSTGSIPGFCSGNGFVSVSAAPSGAFLNAYGPTAVQSFDTGTGLVQFAAGNAGSGSTSVSQGINVLSDVLINQGATTNLDCVPDGSATPPNLGFTYTAGAGSGGGPATFTLSRIIDPNGIFNGSGTACTGTCGSY